MVENARRRHSHHVLVKDRLLPHDRVTFESHFELLSLFLLSELPYVVCSFQVLDAVGEDLNPLMLKSSLVQLLILDVNLSVQEVESILLPRQLVFFLKALI